MVALELNVCGPRHASQPPMNGVTGAQFNRFLAIYCSISDRQRGSPVDQGKRPVGAFFAFLEFMSNDFGMSSA